MTIDYGPYHVEGEETSCPKSDDQQHCTCWYDGEPCCRCGES